MCINAVCFSLTGEDPDLDGRGGGSGGCSPLSPDEPGGSEDSGSLSEEGPPSLLLGVETECIGAVCSGEDPLLLDFDGRGGIGGGASSWIVRVGRELST